MSSQVSVSRDIAAPAAQVYALVADLPRMGELSPENDGARWLGGATGPVVGARFEGTNSNGGRRWKTKGTIVDADPGRAFAFRITAVGVKVAEWRYTFEARGDGCRVTETWTDQRSRLTKAFAGPVSGVSDRAAHNRATMETTLERLQAVAEGASAQL